MNRSIYFMLVVPYTALGVFGFLIYRGMKRNEALHQIATSESGIS